MTAAPAAAADSCGRKVIDDWWDGRIDGTYELRCYDEAIKILPRDVRDYSSAEEDIKRALTNARRGKPAPPNQSGSTETPTTPDDPVETTETTETTSAPPTGRDDPPTDTIATPPVETESASSVPIPLLVLAGLALLLVLGGSAGYVIRRVQARRAPPSAA